uniref:Uncharacterized protein n=1 Tax=Leersia perrieri TaxID=77586 RepID=A0A0D9WY68_9ORYZ
MKVMSLAPRKEICVQLQQSTQRKKVQSPFILLMTVAYSGGHQRAIPNFSLMPFDLLLEDSFILKVRDFFASPQGSTSQQQGMQQEQEKNTEEQEQEKINLQLEEISSATVHQLVFLLQDMNTFTWQLELDLAQQSRSALSTLDSLEGEPSA